MLPIASIRRDLRFQCRGPECNRCCTGGTHGAVIHVSSEDLASLGKDAERFKYIERNGQIYAYVKAGELCPQWEEGKGCLVHGRAPRQCQLYPWWRFLVQDEAVWEQEKERCPGIGEGKKIPLRDVKRELKKDRHSALIRQAGA